MSQEPQRFTVTNLRVEDQPLGQRTELYVQLCDDTFGQPFAIPAIVIRGQEPGPVLGLTAAIHGNELNGVKVIHELLKGLSTDSLRGTLVAVPIMNIPGFRQCQREFNDGVDLNRVMPGKAKGSCSQQYAHALMQRVIVHFDSLIDLHTASFGRINSLYIRADLGHAQTQDLARSFNAEILLHNCGSDGTLRSAAAQHGIPSLTVEVGNPQVLQDSMIGRSVDGLHNALVLLKMLDKPLRPVSEPVICERSYWLYTERGGFLDVQARLRQQVEQGQTLAEISDVFGHLTQRCQAPEAGVVIGRSTNPVNQAGSRIVHLGILGENFSACSLTN